MHAYNFSNKTGFVLEIASTPTWRDVTAQSIEYMINEGASVELFDVSQFSTPASAPRISQGGSSLKPSKRTQGVLTEAEIRKLFTSEMHSIFRTPSPRGQIYQLTLKIASSRARDFAQGFEELLSEKQPDFVVIPNGRVGLAQIASEICKSKGVKALYLETRTGFLEPSGRFFLEPYRVHDRVNRQEWVLSLLPTADLEEYFNLWMVRRISSSSNYNVFNRRWSQLDEGNLLKQSKSGTINLFLNSSTDEFWEGGTQWSGDEWKNQYDAFAKTISLLKKMGETKFVLRLHPNLLSKHVAFVSDELRLIRLLKAEHPDLQILSPRDQANTYQLILEAKRVVTTMSTAGLEASGLGVPVWCTKPTEYDLVADVRRIWSESDLTSENLQLYDVNTRRAHWFVWALSQEGVEYLRTPPHFNSEFHNTTMRILNKDLPLRIALTAKRVFSRKLSELALRSRNLDAIFCDSDSLRK